MVANVSTPKKCPANTRGANKPVLLSPISVAHRVSCYSPSIVDYFSLLIWFL